MSKAATPSEVGLDNTTIVGFVAVFIGMLFALVLPQYIGTQGAQKLRLFVPYASAAMVFFIVALWALFAAAGSMKRLEGAASALARRHIALLVGALLVLWGLLRYPLNLGGDAGKEAIARVGRIVIGGENLIQWVTAGANALALVVVAQLIWCSFGVIRCMSTQGFAEAQSAPTEDLPVVRRGQQVVVELLQAGAAFAFISTSTLYLFFALAAEVGPPSMHSVAKGVASPPNLVACLAEAPAAGLRRWTLNCELSSGKPVEASPDWLRPESTAFAVGVAFATVLFVTLFSAGRAVDRAIGQVEETARVRAGKAPFSGADWRKANGLPESGLAQSVVQAVLLFTPTAAAGLAVLLKG